MTHNFDTEFAKQYGIHEAILMQNILFWLEKNQANNKHFYDKKYWTYNSVSAFQKIFTYMKYSQIRRALEHLQEVGMLVTGNYNKIGYDRTKWYSITEEADKFFGSTICQNRQIDSSNNDNPSAEAEQPIPDSKQLEKPDIAKDQVLNSKEVMKEVLECWNNCSLPKHKIEFVSRKWSKKYTEEIELYGIENVKQAIKNYNIVVNSKDYFFTYKWTLFDFLARGLSKFTEEMTPLENFKIDKTKKKIVDVKKFELGDGR